MVSGYNELEKVSAVETFRNEPAVSKSDEKAVSFRSPPKCPALGILVIFGNGFSVNGGNWVFLYNQSTGASRQFSAGADSFSGNDYRFIIFNLGYYLQPGAYTMYVCNGLSYYLASANVQITN